MTDERYKFTGSIRQRVFDVMKDGALRTVQTLSTLVNASETSTQSSLRDLRKEKFGGHTVHCFFDASHGNYFYKLDRAERP